MTLISSRPVLNPVRVEDFNPITSPQIYRLVPCESSTNAPLPFTASKKTYGPVIATILIWFSVIKNFILSLFAKLEENLKPSMDFPSPEEYRAEIRILKLCQQRVMGRIEFIHDFISSREELRQLFVEYTKKNFDPTWSSTGNPAKGDLNNLRYLACLERCRLMDLEFSLRSIVNFIVGCTPLRNCFCKYARLESLDEQQMLKNLCEGAEKLFKDDPNYNERIYLR